LQQLPNPHVNESKYKPSYFVKEEEILNFFINDINKLLDNYIPGRQENKPDVIKQLQQIKQQREQKIFQQTQRQHNQEEIINQQRHVIQQLTIENKQIKENNEHLKKKIEEIINKCIEEKKKKM
jgi:predicted RNase H-like nuclease (RuvC/YqgF family)